MNVNGSMSSRKTDKLKSVLKNGYKKRRSEWAALVDYVSSVVGTLSKVQR